MHDAGMPSNEITPAQPRTRHNTDQPCQRCGSRDDVQVMQIGYAAGQRPFVHCHRPWCFPCRDSFAKLVDPAGWAAEQREKSEVQARRDRIAENYKNGTTTVIARVLSERELRTIAGMKARGH